MKHSLGLLVYPMLLGLLLLVIAVHEIGHLIGAMLVGETVLGLSIGPVMIERRRRGIRLHWHGRSPHPDGYLWAVPDFRRDVRLQMLVTTASGPGANLLIGVLLGTALAAAESMHWEGPQVWLAVFAAFNVFLGLLNLAPIASIGTDGSKLVDWWTENAASRRVSEILRLYDHSLRGGLPSDLPEKALSPTLANNEPATRLWWLHARLALAQELGNFSELQEVMAAARALMAEIGPIGYPAVRLLWAYFIAEECFALAVCGAEIMIETIDLALLGRLPRRIRYRYLAATHACAGEIVQAQNALEAAQAEAEGLVDEGERRYEALLIARLQGAVAHSH